VNDFIAVGDKQANPTVGATVIHDVIEKNAAKPTGNTHGRMGVWCVRGQEAVANLFPEPRAPVMSLKSGSCTAGLFLNRSKTVMKSGPFGGTTNLLSFVNLK
jgi:hypothetical protein